MTSKPTGSSVCLTVAEPTVEAVVNRVESLQSLIDLVEVRADFLRPEEIAAVDRIPKLSPVPAVFTLRRENDGGRWTGTESERRSILRRAAGAGYAFLDLESDVSFGVVEQRCGETETTVIRSVHDFDGVPSDLTRTVRDLPHRPGEIAKAAVMPRSTQDLLRIVDTFAALSGMEKILIGMGPWGFPTRILAGKLGSMLSFCSPPAEEVAPGHIDPATLVETYRFRSITEATEVFCIIGNPVMHSKSPWIHNPALQALKMDAVYVPIQVDDPEVFFRLIPALDIKGVSVTIPHKSAVREFLGVEDEAVAAVGACNTVYTKGDTFCGANTDVPGFVAPLSLFASREEIGRMAVTVVGAGGTARSVVYALRELGARVLIVNRTPDRAADLAGEFGCSWAGLGDGARDRIAQHSDLIVQTTSAGMHRQADLDPLGFYEFSGNEIVYDVIYAPPETKMLSRAVRAGCRTLNGSQMLLEQAYLQFELFTGRAYPLELRGKTIN